MFQDDIPPHLPRPPFPSSTAKPHPNKSFRIINVTPRSMDLLNAVIDRSADFDRALAEVGVHPTEEACPVASKVALDTYSDLVQAKGKLVEYMATLMDRVGSPTLNQKRTTQVRFS